MKTQPNILEYCYIIICQVFFHSVVLFIYFTVNVYAAFWSAAGTR